MALSYPLAFVYHVKTHRLHIYKITVLNHSDNKPLRIKYQEVSCSLDTIGKATTIPYKYSGLSLQEQLMESLGDGWVSVGINGLSMAVFVAHIWVNPDKLKI